ncbi:MAG: aminoacyltransferase [Patescibacteria group bacterium]|nr:aminoacyltransferase [Patescibacteria group bacterium]
MIKEILIEKEWNEYINNKSFYFTYSWEWGQLQENLNRKIYRFIFINNKKDIKYPIFLIEYNLFWKFKYLYSPKGPILNTIQEIESLKELANDIKIFFNNKKDKNYIFIEIEPIFGFLYEMQSKKNSECILNFFKKNCFKKIKDRQPSTTIIINLNKNIDTIFKEIKKDRRYAINLAIKNNVKILNFDNQKDKLNYFDIFWKIFIKTNKRHKIKYYDQNYYKEILNLNNKCYSELFLAEYDKKFIAGAILIIYQNIGYYFLAASDENFSKINAPSLIAWEMIKKSKNLGLKYFDFVGISLTNKKWAGLTNFKKDFGGDIISHIGTFDFIFNRFLYIIYKILKLFKNIF